MIFGPEWIYIAIIATAFDFIIGEFPFKHPVQYMGDYIEWFEKNFYKDCVIRGFVLFTSTVLFTAAFISLVIYLTDLIMPEPVAIIILGMLGSWGIASKSLKEYVKKVLFSPNDAKKRENLSILVTRDTNKLDEKGIYSSVIETHSENLGDGVISPIVYLILFGVPGITVFKAVSTLDSMVGYKDQKCKNYGKISAVIDDVLNYIPARITALLIWIAGGFKASIRKIIKEAPKYSSSPNAGYPVAAAANTLGIQVGGTFYYGDQEVKKGLIGDERTQDYKQAALNFLDIHTKIEIMIITLLIITLVFIKIL